MIELKQAQTHFVELMAELFQIDALSATATAWAGAEYAGLAADDPFPEPTISDPSKLFAELWDKVKRLPDSRAAP